MKHTNSFCGQNEEFLNVETSGTQCNHWALKVNKLRRYTMK